MLRDAWTLAIETLSIVEQQQSGARLSLAKAIKRLGIQDTNALKLAHKLVFETLRRNNLIDFILNSVLAPQSLLDLKRSQRAFLRLYTYETNMTATDLETAANVAKLGRSILGWRELENVEHVLGLLISINSTTVVEGAEDAKRIGLSTYHPTWFVHYCYKLFGRREALNFLEKNGVPTPTYLRVNTLKATDENIPKKLEDEGITLEKEPQLQHTYKVVRSQKPLTRSQSFREGLFYIQDKASCLATVIANPNVGATVLDVCAAPGAKTTHLAQLMENNGAIYSVDYSRRRMRIWNDEIKRMGVKVAQPIVANARVPVATNLSADLVFIDPPCTSTGVFGKTPSAKWRLNKRSIFGMAKIQWEMLNTYSSYVKRGGHLVYSTCSITVEENEMLIEKFLQWHPEFEFEETLPKIGLPGLRGQQKCQRLYPHRHECNGFFVAKLLKECA